MENVFLVCRVATFTSSEGLDSRHVCEASPLLSVPQPHSRRPTCEMKHEIKKKYNRGAASALKIPQTVAKVSAARLCGEFLFLPFSD